MILHTVRPGETFSSIAKTYAVSPLKLMEINAPFFSDCLSVGQQLLILLPTRSYTVRSGDTLSGILHRFGIKRRTLFANNPGLAGSEKLMEGEELALRFDTQKAGMTASNGYLFPGCHESRFRTVLPFLTYVTVDAAQVRDSVMLYYPGLDNAVSLAKQSGKTLLLRLRPLGETNGQLPADEEKFFSDAVSLAKKHGFDGLTLSVDFSVGIPSQTFALFVLRMKKRLLGQDLILFTETYAHSDAMCADLSDGNVLLYSKSRLSEPPSFSEGERKICAAYSHVYESSKAFLQLPSFGYDNGTPLSLSEIPELAFRNRCEILTDDETLLSSFRYSRKTGGKKSEHFVSFDSLENIKAKLALTEEFGFMGTAFDISQVPIPVLMMIHATFSEVDYSFGIPSEAENV